MEASMQGNSSGNDKGKKKEAETSSSSLPSSLIEATISKISKRKERSNIGTRRFYFDNRAQGYEWLLPGWVAEERHMPSGRIYKYYYDPEANLYLTQGEVINAWEDAAVVFIRN